jgi:hypothetical protein
MDVVCNDDQGTDKELTLPCLQTFPRHSDEIEKEGGHQKPLTRTRLEGQFSEIIWPCFKSRFEVAARCLCVQKHDAGVTKLSPTRKYSAEPST